MFPLARRHSKPRQHSKPKGNLVGIRAFFVPILGGYILVRRCHWLRLTGSQESGYHTLFRAAIAGAVLLVVGWVLDVLVIDPRLPNSIYKTGSLKGLEGVIPLALSMLLSLVFAPLVNIIYDEDRASRRAMDKHHEILERLIFQVASNDEDFFLEVTMSSGKVYVGWVLGATALANRKYLEMLPVASGYRSKERLKVEFTTDYASAIDAATVVKDESKRDNFRVVLPTSEIASARPFYRDVYHTFQQTQDVDTSSWSED